MVSIKVLFFAIFREKYGLKETNLEFNGTLDGFLDALGKKVSPEIVDDIFDSHAKEIRDNLVVMINGKNVQDIRGKIKFNNNDVVAIFPPVGGG